LESDSDAQRVDMQVVVTRGMNDTAQAALGAADYILVHRDKIVMIMFPRPAGRTVLITAEADFPPEKVRDLLGVVDRYYQSNPAVSKD